MNDSIDTRLEVAEVKGDLKAMGERMRSHEKQDDERYNSILANSQQTLSLMTEFGRKLDNGFERVHGRIDAETEARVRAVSGNLSKISALKVWWLGGAAVMLLSIVVFFVVPFFEHKPDLVPQTVPSRDR